MGAWFPLGPGPTWVPGFPLGAGSHLGPWFPLGPGPTWVPGSHFGPGPTWVHGSHLGPGPTWVPGSHLGPGLISNTQWPISNSQWHISNSQWHISNIQWPISNSQWPISDIYLYAFTRLLHSHGYCIETRLFACEFLGRILYVSCISALVFLQVFVCVLWAVLWVYFAQVGVSCDLTVDVNDS